MRAMLDRLDMRTITQRAVEHGMIPMNTLAVSLIESHVTSPHEIRRVFG